MRGVERFLDRLGDPAAVRHSQAMFASPIAHRLNLVATRGRRPDGAEGPPRRLSGDPGAIFDEFRQLAPQAVGVLCAQVDLEVSAVKTQVDRFNFFGRPIEVVDKEGPSDCCHAVNIPEWPSVREQPSACLQTAAACRDVNDALTPVSRAITTFSEAVLG